MISISIIGYGYVGGAIGYLCEKNNIDFNVCDNIEKSGKFTYFNDIKSLMLENNKEYRINYYFIAVPTPSNELGECDTTIVESVLSKLNLDCTGNSRVIIKSTLVPGTCKVLQDKYKNIDIIFCPEFLREVSFKDDMYNASFILLGIQSNFSMNKYQELLVLFRELYKHNNQIDIYKKSYEECELFKYTLNVHLAVKVWYFNEIYEISNKLGVNYEKLKDMFKLDSRIGEYGTKVPGNDGKFSFSGTCLPKELRGMIKLQEKLNLPNETLIELMKRSDILRLK